MKLENNFNKEDVEFTKNIIINYGFVDPAFMGINDDNNAIYECFDRYNKPVIILVNCNNGEMYCRYFKVETKFKKVR